MSAPTSSPIIILKTNRAMTSQVNATLTKMGFLVNADAGGILEGFQILNRYGFGVLALVIDQRKDYLLFYKALTILVRSVATSDIKILIFTNSPDILDSRALAQFQFIRSQILPKKSERIVELLSRECRSLDVSIASTRKRQSQQKDKVDHAPLLVIKGDNPGSQSHFTKGTYEPGPSVSVRGSVNTASSATLKDLDPATSALSKCLGEDTPTFLYNMDLQWRVRGFFKGLDPEKGILTFEAKTDSGGRKLLSQLNEQKNLLSSSSSVDGRVCGALEFLAHKKNEFQFRYPRHLKVIQRRSVTRKRVLKGSQFLVRLVDKNLDVDQLFAVFDYGAEGVGFFIDRKARPQFAPGTYIGPLTLYFTNKEVTVPEAEIRHVSKAENDPKLLVVGLKFKTIAPKDASFMAMVLYTESL